jgi:HTH-type transcriptional regulator/antitoxin HigA
MKVDIKPIHTEANRKAALAEIERLWDAAPGTPDFEKVEVLATLVDAYEASQAAS